MKTFDLDSRSGKMEALEYLGFENVHVGMQTYEKELCERLKDESPEYYKEMYAQGMVVLCKAALKYYTERAFTPEEPEETPEELEDGEEEAEEEQEVSSSGILTAEEIQELQSPEPPKTTSERTPHGYPLHPTTDREFNDTVTWVTGNMKRVTTIDGDPMCVLRLENKGLVQVHLEDLKPVSGLGVRVTTLLQYLYSDAVPVIPESSLLRVKLQLGLISTGIYAQLFDIYEGHYRQAHFPLKDFKLELAWLMAQDMENKEYSSITDKEIMQLSPLVWLQEAVDILSRELSTKPAELYWTEQFALLKGEVAASSLFTYMELKDESILANMEEFFRLPMAEAVIANKQIAEFKEVDISTLNIPGLYEVLSVLLANYSDGVNLNEYPRQFTAERYSLLR